MKALLLSLILLLSSNTFSQEVIDISVKGISDSKNDGAQQDRLEAILDAKRQACEKAGMKLESNTTVENFQTVYDYVESSSKGVLLPGFQIIEIGYTKDETYQVVLTGKVEKIDDDGISNKELRYAKSLYALKKHRECKAILSKFIKNKDNEFAEEQREIAFYLFMRWGYSFDIESDFVRFKSYYPKSKYLSALSTFLEKKKKPLLEKKLEKTVDKKAWQKFDIANDGKSYSKIITLTDDTLTFKDLDNVEYKVSTKFSLHTDKKSEIVANDVSIFLIDPKGEKHEIMNKFRNLSSKTSTSFHISTSSKRIGNLAVSNILVKGSVPVNEAAACKLTFTIKQIAF